MVLKLKQLIIQFIIAKEIIDQEDVMVAVTQVLNRMFAKPIARPVFQGWQSVLEESCGKKSETSVHTLCYQNQMDNVCTGKD